MKGTITVVVKGANTAEIAADRNNKQLIFKNCAPFNDCISEINSAQVHNAKDLDIVMPMYNLIGYSDNYGKTTGSLWQYCRDEPNDNHIKDSE